MRKASLLALSLVILVSATASVACTSGGSSRSFSAQLSGADAGVNTQGQGEATFQVSGDGTSISYKLTVRNVENITMAHIHLAPKGQNGEVVAWLYPSAPPPKEIPGRFDGTLAEGAIQAANLVGPLEGRPLSALIEAMQKGDTYVNVHTQQYPNGEIRGQIK